jgi:hypothetical protein
MKRVWILPSLVIVLLTALATTGYASAFPSQGFSTIGVDILDDWEICRTRAFGEDGFYQITETGFRPVIAFESLGDQADAAYSLGEQITNEYPDRLQRAEAVFHFVRDRVKYASDIDLNGSEEFAQNADELATTIVEDGIGQGDCEDIPEHTALLVYLPEYDEATAFFELAGESGWVWAEATGRNNHLGWAPKEYLGTKIAAYEILAEIPAYGIPVGSAAPLTPSPAAAIAFAGTGERSFSPPYLFFIVIGLLWCLSLFRRRRRR